MNEKSWERAGAAAGIVTVVLLVVSTFLVPQVPRVDSSAARFITWVSGHRRGIEVQGILGMFASGTLLWFVSHLRHVLHRAEDGAEAFAPLVFGSGVLLTAILAIGAIPTTTLALMSGQPGGLTTGDSSMVRTLIVMSQVLLAPFFIVAAVFLVALGAAMLRHELLNGWLGYVAFLAAAACGVSVVTTMAAGSYNSAALIIGFAGFLGFALVIGVASAEMLWAPEATREVEHRPVFMPAHA